MNKIFCVISHTHWDREWYMPLELFKLKLVDLIDRCLAILDREPAYIFHLDAQTIVLEDYLTVRPNQRQKLINYITDGSLIVGPWYLQNDFYLTSGEATVRNLIEGHKIAAEFGACAKNGYIPDQFGNISQLPQILADFKIDNVIFGRGYSKYFRDEKGHVHRKGTKTEFIWEGADGTKALAVHMLYWYNNAQRFSYNINKAMAQLQGIENSFAHVALTPYLLLMNGVDHLEAQDDLTDILAQMNERLPEEKIIKQYRMEDYIREVKKYIADHGVALETHRGELRDGNDWEILQGTLSSRPYLKQANVKAQDMLEVQLEPLYSMLELAGAKGAYSLDHFRYMWKDLMKNHPHDSICGCSRDEVHYHMEDNFDRLSHTAGEILRRGMDIAASHLDIDGYSDENYVIALANTTELERSGYVRVTIDIPQKDKFEGIEIYDANGEKVHFTVLAKYEALRDAFSTINLPGMINVDRYIAYVDVPQINPYAFRGYTVRRSETANAITDEFDVSDFAIENEYLKVTVTPDGQADVYNKYLDKAYANILDFEESADFGDAYVYQSDKVLTWASQFPACVRVTEYNDFVKTIEISRSMTVPAYYDFYARRRSPETAVCDITVSLTLEKYSRLLKISYKINNRAKDHRIRLALDTGIVTDTCIADIPFDVIAHTPESYCITSASPVVANTSFAVLESGGYGAGIITQGLHEAEHAGTKLLFTVARCTGVISRNATPLQSEQWNCPDNQLIRSLTGDLWFATYYGGYIENNIPVLAKQTKNGILAQYGACDTRKFLVGRAIVQDTPLDEYYYLADPYENIRLADNQTLVSAYGKGLLVTALKKAEQNDGIILRAVNLSGETQKSVFAVNGTISTTTMSEKEKAFAVKNIYTVHLTGKKIITLYIE